jgi:hypothetical protein
MRKDLIDNMVKIGELRIRQKDAEKIKSIIKSAENTASVVKSIKLDENSATVIFREMYEAIRQLGDAKWWLLGFEPLSHDVSLEILKELDIKEKFRLNFLKRFKKIRHDANYRGFRVTASQAKELLDFWDTCGKEIIAILKKELL